MLTSSLKSQVEQLRELRYRQLAAELEGERVDVCELEAAVDRLLSALDDTPKGQSFYGSDLIIRPSLPPLLAEAQMACA
ncbi:MAG TPA: hypothetical protein VGN26_20570 [Armatimonadota bacterium]|jgi:hypothetical protein